MWWNVWISLIEILSFFFLSQWFTIIREDQWDVQYECVRTIALVHCVKKKRLSDLDKLCSDEKLAHFIARENLAFSKLTKIK